MNMRWQKAFTLVELMVVILIIAIVATVSVLSISGLTSKRHIQNTALQLTGLLQLAEQRAVIASSEIGFVMDGEHYQFVSFKPGEDVAWQPINQGVLAGRHPIPPDINLQVKSTVKTDNDAAPSVLFYSSGEVSPFSIYIGRIASQSHYRVVGRINGDIKLNQLK